MGYYMRMQSPLGQSRTFAARVGVFEASCRGRTQCRISVGLRKKKKMGDFWLEMVSDFIFTEKAHVV